MFVQHEMHPAAVMVCSNAFQYQYHNRSCNIGELWTELECGWGWTNNLIFPVYLKKIAIGLSKRSHCPFLSTFLTSTISISQNFVFNPSPMLSIPNNVQFNVSAIHIGNSPCHIVSEKHYENRLMRSSDHNYRTINADKTTFWYQSINPSI